MFLTIIVFIVILGILIFVHELGHFLTAKKSGIKVEEFGFGFPPRMLGVKKGETVYSLNWIPLGGFVKIKGESGQFREEPDSFSHKPFWQRGLVLAAGVLMNVVLAFILLSVGFMFGLPVAVSSDDLLPANSGAIRVQLSGVIENSPAARAGLKVGDQILALDNQAIAKEEEVPVYVQSHQDQPIMVKIKRSAGEIRELAILPEEIAGATSRVLGVNLVQTAIIRYGFFESWYRGGLATLDLLWKIISAFYQLLRNLILGLGVSAGLAGPVGVAVMTGQVMDLGLRYILQFAALLSLNLAVINFLPFPALDGGRFLFLVIEKIRRRPNNLRVENAIHNLGFSLLLLLVAIITYRDVIKYGNGVLEKIKELF